MKNILLYTAIAAVLALIFPVGMTSCGSSHAKAPDTLRINTTDFAADVIGFNGPTPVEISVHKGVITGIEVLPNREGPRYLQAVMESGLLDRLTGKTLEEAKTIELDAVSGATFTSKALIENIKRGVADGGAYQANAPKPLALVKVKQGKVQGKVEHGIGTFMGIPFAESPEGELRWKAPVPKKAWKGVFDATEASAAGPDLARRPGPEGDRGLPVPERPDPGRIGQGEASRPGVDPWRRLYHGGCEFQRRNLVRQAGNRVREPELPDRCARIPLAAGALRRK